VRTPPLLSPVENENSDLLIIHILGERSWEGLSPFTVLTMNDSPWPNPGEGTKPDGLYKDCSVPQPSFW